MCRYAVADSLRLRVAGSRDWLCESVCRLQVLGLAAARLLHLSALHAHPSCSGEEVSLIGDAWRILHELATDARWQDVQIAYVSRTDEPRECVAVVGGLGA